jgi:pilus assembly protein Flp/PilA
MIRAFLRDEQGATAIEYALIAGLISMAIILGATQIGSNLASIFGNVAAGFN